MENDAPTLDSDQVERLLAVLLIQTKQTLTVEQYQLRLSEILRLVGIDAVGDSTGIRFGGGGVPEDDQPLVFAIREIFSRRFAIDP